MAQCEWLTLKWQLGRQSYSCCISSMFTVIVCCGSVIEHFYLCMNCSTDFSDELIKAIVGQHSMHCTQSSTLMPLDTTPSQLIAVFITGLNLSFVWYSLTTASN